MHENENASSHASSLPIANNCDHQLWGMCLTLFLSLESLTEGAISTAEYFQGLSDIEADVLGGVRWSIRSRN